MVTKATTPAIAPAQPIQNHIAFSAGNLPDYMGISPHSVIDVAIHDLGAFGPGGKRDFWLMPGDHVRIHLAPGLALDAGSESMVLKNGGFDLAIHEGQRVAHLLLHGHDILVDTDLLAPRAPGTALPAGRGGP